MEVGGFESISLSFSREERNSLAWEPECQFLEKAAQACIKADGRASGELSVSQGQGLSEKGRGKTWTRSSRCSLVSGEKIHLPPAQKRGTRMKSVGASLTQREAVAGTGIVQLRNESVGTCRRDLEIPRGLSWD